MNAPAPTASLSLDEINLGDPDFLMSKDYEAGLALLREQRPISWHEHPAIGPGYWVFVDYDDIAEVNRDWETFSSKYGIFPSLDINAPLRVRPENGSALVLDPPEHTANRKTLAKGFTPRQVIKLEGYVREQARRLVSQFNDGDVIDFVEQIAEPLPFEIICDLMGVAQSDRAHLLKLSNMGRAEHEPSLAESPEVVEAAVQELRDFGVALAAEKMADPKEDLTSEFALLRIDGQPLPVEQIGGYFALLLSAGSGTTRAALAHGMHAFSKFPDQKRIFMLDFEGLEMSMTEEIIRWATPIKSMIRVLTHDIVFKGVEMKAGQKVAMWYPAANRDARIFPDPYAFDISRDPNLHQSFGGGGPHFCVGAHLARREIRVLFQELFGRFPGTEVIGEPVPLRSLQLNGILRLDVRLSA